MTDKICLIPCNGLDKAHGVITREVAIKISANDENVELICPVLYNANEKKYSDILLDSKIIVIDGCATRCAVKLADDKGLKISKRVFIPDMSKKFKLHSGKKLALNEEGVKLVGKIADEVVRVEIPELTSTTQPKEKERKFENIEYFETTVDKYHFRVPKEGYYFTENDCWVKIEGKTALIGITDYFQNKAGDVIFVDLPTVGEKIDQFDEAADFESVKALLQLLTPVSGKIIAINSRLEETPEFLNVDAYEQGWVVEVELADFEDDKELLMDGPTYFEYMKRKIVEEN